MLIKVEAYHDGKFWCGRGIRADFFTQGKTLDEFIKNVKEAASLHVERRLKSGYDLGLCLTIKGAGRSGGSQPV